MAEKGDALKGRITTFFKDFASYFEGKGCPKTAQGYSRDHRRDCKQANWGLVITEQGIPITLDLEVYPGNTPDKTTVIDTCNRLRKIFHVQEGIWVGDRGMMSEENVRSIEEMRYHYILTEILRNVKEVILEVIDDKPTSLGDGTLLGRFTKSRIAGREDGRS